MIVIPPKIYDKAVEDGYDMSAYTRGMEMPPSPPKPRVVRYTNREARRAAARARRRKG